MSNGFSWSNILNGAADGAAAKTETTPEPTVPAAPPAAPPVAPPVSSPEASDLPFGGFDANKAPEGGFQAESSLPPVTSGAPVRPILAPDQIPTVQSDQTELKDLLAKLQQSEVPGTVPPFPTEAPARIKVETNEETQEVAPAHSVAEVPAAFSAPVAPPISIEPPAVVAPADEEPPPVALTPPTVIAPPVTGAAPVAESDPVLEAPPAAVAPPVFEIPAPAIPIAPPVAPPSMEVPPTVVAPPVAETADAPTPVAEEELDWSMPPAAPEVPKVSPKLAEPIDTPLMASDDVDEAPTSSYHHVAAEEIVAPPAFNVPVIAPPVATPVAKDGLSTPVSELSTLKKAAQDAGLPPCDETHIDEILTMAVERKASDIHITVGVPPMARIDGEILPLPWAPLNPEHCRRMIYEVLNDDQLEKFERTHELDFAHTVQGVGRFRFNVYMQRGTVTGAMRAIPNKIPEFETLGLPPVIREMAKRTSGLVLVTGPTGSGKSTTIATIIDDINRSRKGHILTIEDPIEYLHQHRNCIVNQREMHSDTYSFHNALRAVLREDPDIILVGELRDLETIEAALTLAETGHLVFGTLHTRNAPSTIDRIIDVFPPESQAQIRVLLANTIEGVISQQLLAKLGGGRRASIEIMLATPAIKNLIREGKTHQMYSSIETGGQMGMQTMDAALADLYRSGQCDYEECVMRAIDKENFARMAKR